MLAVACVLSATSFLGPSTMAPSMRLASSARSSDVAMSGAIPTKKAWVDFAKASDCPPGAIASGFRYGQELAIANVGGSLYALSNKLPPTGQPATLGTIEKLSGQPVIVEPVSGTCFSLKSGKVTGPWCPSTVGRLLLQFIVQPSDVPVYPVRKSGDKIQCQINVNLKAQFESNYWRGILDSQGKVDGGYY